MDPNVLARNMNSHYTKLLLCESTFIDIRVIKTTIIITDYSNKYRNDHHMVPSLYFNI